MKNPYTSKPRKGFTLVELLVVIAIIAVLAAAGFAGGTAALNKARKLSAQAAATSLSTAIDQFYTEYSSLPEGSGTGTGSIATDSAAGVSLLNILAASESGTDIENERKVRFLSIKEAKNGTRDGLAYDSSGDAITGLYDPWGQPYYIVLDDDYDEKIEVEPGQGIDKVTLNGRHAAIYSLGVKNVGDANKQTLVKSW